MTRYAPADVTELREAVGEALATEEAIEVVAGGSKHELGRPLQLPHVLDLSGLSGIRDYEPSELVLTAGAATPLAEIDRVLAEAGQMLAFEPPDWGRAPGGARGRARPANPGRRSRLQLSGPRRIRGGSGARPFPRFSRGQRPRRGLQGRRQGSQERHRL